MSSQGILVLILVIAMITILMRDRMRPGITLFTIVVIMMAAGIIDSKEALAGFSNRGMITVGLLYLVSEGVSRSGALDRIAHLMLPHRKGSLTCMLSRMLAPVSLLSAFLNNTPIVIIFAPMIKRWSEKMNVPSKKLLIPLSYATILGGMCTVIGTTTNLVVDGMMISETGKGMPIFEIGKVGLPIAIVGLLYIIFASRYLLPKDDDIKPEDKTGIKEYYYDVTIPENSKFIGTSIVNGQTDIIPNIEIKNIKSENKIINSYDSDHIIKINDKLEIAGRSSLLNALMGNKDIRLNCLQNRDHNFKEKATIQVEAVLAPRFPGIGKTLEEFDFYRHYGAAIMSIHRNGTRINENLEEVRLQVGDNLLLLTDDSPERL